MIGRGKEGLTGLLGGGLEGLAGGLGGLMPEGFDPITQGGIGQPLMGDLPDFGQLMPDLGGFNLKAMGIGQPLMAPNFDEWGTN